MCVRGPLWQRLRPYARPDLKHFSLLIAAGLSARGAAENCSGSGRASNQRKERVQFTMGRRHLGLPDEAAGPQSKGFGENSNMQISHRARAGLIALAAMVGAGVFSAAYADSGIVRLSVVKGGWFIGANGGSGTLIFNGRKYPLSVGGIDAGLVFGLSQTTLVGRVINIRRPSDVTGVYVAAGAGAAVGIGARLVQLANDKGAVLQLEGRQIGLMANLDLSGLAIALR